MPPLTRWFIKSSLVYLIAALITGVTLAMQAPLHLPPAIRSLMPVYLHLFMVGWVAQFIFGVVYWMFPKYSKEKPRGSQELAWATYGLLNVGLILRAVGEPLQALRPEAGFGWLLALSAVLQWLGGMAFVINSWARVK
jgi:cbb3-type cytochrome oxidase subunit 1